MRSIHAASPLRRTLVAAACCVAFAASPTLASVADHREFEATLHAPYQADPGSRFARTFTLTFDYPFAQRNHGVGWRLDLLAKSGQVLKRWRGATQLDGGAKDVRLKWSDADSGRAIADGAYRVRLQAVARGGRAPVTEGAIDRALSSADGDVIEQSWDIVIGKAGAPRMPEFAAMASTKALRPTAVAAPATGSLPFTVYYANLHSQTSHSDGGGDLSACKGAQAPQGGAHGPRQAYAFARERGLDILMASEHNHMYDGSEGPNPEASPDAAKALYQAGLAAAGDFSAANPGFLALYGMEWGVINNGGHVNILNAPELLAWESDADGRLIGDTFTAKGDYAGLYALMRQRGWLGQFNHPAVNGQFNVNGVALGYTEDGDEAMALCEVLNTSAFSANTTETETRRSNFEMACNKALEAGFHVAFSSNQDNHCANWGASFTNRTGVLIPNGVSLTQESFVEAVKARRVFATMDKNSQLVLTANGHVMGARIANSGVLRLAATYANSEGRTVAAVSIVEGVPGRKGSVSEVAATAEAEIVPARGEHFYYAKITQDDGKILWSAPIWVTQE
ncbi:CehA/McbA family metallohydrolase [Massilia cavernae]|uniref:Phosphotransferase n=1 Tax=Massilia cavernae TaxID=2320864 RepID=A0A418Y6U6_9BURK|nr:CehA/McbA family metallohydrolase [Massilia cavernae]RJG24167.1 phosphotransferase [Massilia cavernae]